MYRFTSYVSTRAMNPFGKAIANETIAVSSPSEASPVLVPKTLDKFRRCSTASSRMSAEQPASENETKSCSYWCDLGASDTNLTPCVEARDWWAHRSQWKTWYMHERVYLSRECWIICPQVHYSCHRNRLHSGGGKSKKILIQCASKLNLSINHAPVWAHGK